MSDWQINQPLIQSKRTSDFKKKMLQSVDISLTLKPLLNNRGRGGFKNEIHKHDNAINSKFKKTNEQLIEVNHSRTQCRISDFKEICSSLLTPA